MTAVTSIKRRGRLLRVNNPALSELRTVFKTKVVPVAGTASVLKPGRDNKKVGSRVTKGEWKGMPIWTLTLEERKTCSPGCPNLRRCYGNNMHLAARVDHTDPDFYRALRDELLALQQRNPQGFVVRLHILGDFFSTAYALFWATALLWYPALRIYGYTAWERASEVGKTILNLRTAHPDRFRVRFSNQGEANVIPFPIRARGKSSWGIVCPAQTHDNVTCATCTLCWALHSSQPIAFMEH